MPRVFFVWGINDGLGCEPVALQRHLAKLDSSLDSSFFTHIFRLLCAHPSIQLIRTSHPLPNPDGNLVPGTAPLRADHIGSSAAQDGPDRQSFVREGIKGRQLAFHLAGEEYRTDKQVVQDKRAKADKIREERWVKKQVVDENGAGPSHDIPHKHGRNSLNAGGAKGPLLRVLREDDLDVEGKKVIRTDLVGLIEKWGSRLRIRCTDQEIYFRLVGTHQKVDSVPISWDVADGGQISMITPMVFHILQLAASTREKGITAVELGPLVGSGQKSMHHYMKVLTKLKLW